MEYRETSVPVGIGWAEWSSPMGLSMSFVTVPVNGVYALVRWRRDHRYKHSPFRWRNPKVFQLTWPIIKGEGFRAVSNATFLNYTGKVPQRPLKERESIDLLWLSGEEVLEALPSLGLVGHKGDAYSPNLMDYYVELDWYKLLVAWQTLGFRVADDWTGQEPEDEPSRIRK